MIDWKNLFKGQVTYRRRVTVDRRYTGTGWARVCRWRELASRRCWGQCGHAFSTGTPEPVHREGNWLLLRTVQVTLVFTAGLSNAYLCAGSCPELVTCSNSCTLHFSHRGAVTVISCLLLNDREGKWHGAALTDGGFLPAPRGGVLL